MNAESSGGATAALDIPGAVRDEARSGGGYKWYVLGLLVMIYVLSTIDRLVLSVVTEPMKAEFHLTDKDIGGLAMAFSVAFGVAVLPMGWLVDRVSRRIFLGIAVAAWSVLTCLCAFTTNYASLLLARMGVGLGEAPSGPACLSLIADTFPITQRNTAVGIYTGGTAIGQIVLFVVGGWLMLHFNWRDVFLLAGGPGFFLTLLLFFTTREPVRGSFDEKPIDQKRAAAGQARFGKKSPILANPSLLLAMIALTFATGTAYSVTVWVTSFLIRLHGQTVSQAAIWTGVGFGVCTTIGALAVGPLADRYSRGNPYRLAVIPLIATTIAFIGGTVMVLSLSLPMSLAGLGLMGIMTGFFMSTGYSLVMSLSAPDQRGTTLAMTKLFTVLIGDGPVPLLTGAISDAVGGPGSLRPALLGTMFLLLISAFSYLLVRRAISRQQKNAVTA